MSMLRKIILENFMAHERTELELGPGVTALTGPNNTGKSAVVEGLRCLATNPMPKNYIRHGAKEARVTAELEDGTRVVWIRKKRSSGYEIWAPDAEEAEEYWKFGRKPPEDVLDLLRLDMVELDTGREIDLHIGNQRTPVFLLDRPDSDAAAFFAASTESAHLLSMQSILKRRTADAKRRERDLETRLAEVEADLDELQGLPKIALALETAREMEAAATRLQRETPDLEHRIKTLTALEESVAEGRSIAAILDALDDPPKLNPTGDLDRIKRTMITVNDRRTHALEVNGELDPLESPPQLGDVGGLQAVCDDLRSAQRRLQTALALDGVAAPLTPPPPMQDISHLSHMIDDILILQRRTGRLSGLGSVLKNIAEPPELAADDHLLRTVAEMRSLTAVMTEAKDALEELEKGLQSTVDELQTRLGDDGRCPTCGAEANAEDLLDQGGRHVH